jgi:hypothetical protein
VNRFLKFILVVLAAIVAVLTLWTLFTLNWSYAKGERAGYVQKLSEKGWICKTWEGEMAMVSLPGSRPEKFHFTVWDDKVAEKVNQAMGKRVSLQYEQKVGIPTRCFGETRYYVTGVQVVDVIPLTPGTVVPATEASAKTLQPVAGPPKTLP